MPVTLKNDLRVEDALEAGTFRVRPDTRLSDAVALMVREGLRAVPVVGESSEVMGILTSGDALGRVLETGGGDESAAAAEESPVRDHMTRSVLCVSLDQPLSDAANMLVNRGVAQLPVVREGEFVGFITADSILAAFAHIQAPPEEEAPSKRRKRAR